MEGMYIRMSSDVYMYGMRQNKVLVPCLYNLRKPHSRRNYTNTHQLGARNYEEQLIGIAGVLCYSMFCNSSHNNLGKQATTPISARAGIKHNTAMLVQ